MEQRGKDVNLSALFLGLQVTSLLLLLSDLLLQPKSRQLIFIVHALALLLSTNTIGWVLFAFLWKKTNKIISKQFYYIIISLIFGVVLLILSIPIIYTHTISKIVSPTIGFLLLVFISITMGCLYFFFLQKLVDNKISRFMQISTLIFVILMIYIDNRIFPNLYMEVHRVLRVLVFFSLIPVVTSFFKAITINLSKILLWGTGLLFLIPYLTFPQSTQEKVALLATRFTYKYFRINTVFTDVDRDHYSSILGGGDYYPFDPHKVYPEGKITQKNLCPPSTTSVKTEKIHSVILITIDALRADAPQWSDIAPTLHKFYEQGVVFDNAYAPATATRYSIPMLISSCYKSDPSCHKLPFILKQAGFITALFSTRPFQLVLENKTKGRCDIHKSFDYLHILKIKQIDSHKWGYGEGYFLGDQVTENAIKWIRKHKNKKFFVWIHYFDVHQWMYLTKRSYMEAWEHPRKSYKEVLHMLDYKALLPLYLFIKQSGLLNNTMIIITADHGEGLGEHDTVTHTRKIYESLVRVPLSIYLPGITPVHRKQPVGLIDIKPTVISLLLGPSYPMKTDGCNIASLILQKSNKIYSRVFLFRTNQQQGELVYPFKLIFQPRENLLFLYNVKKDPYERQDLSSSLISVKSMMFQDFLARFRMYFPKVIP